jgi:hypothetical protein
MNKKRGPTCADPQIFSLGILGLLSGLRHWENRNKGAALEALVELHCAIDSCKDCVILAHANAHAWPHLCATLTHDDVAGDDSFATEFLYTKTTTS